MLKKKSNFSVQEFESFIFNEFILKKIILIGHFIFLLAIFLHIESFYSFI